MTADITCIFMLFVVPAEWFALSWNMAVPEVRANRVAHVREMLAQAR
jgi:hypothetical protein